jgi:nicotinamidase-related amidase
MPDTARSSAEALIVVDVQDGFDDPDFWGPTANPDAEKNIDALITTWRTSRRGPVAIVRHDSNGTGSPLHPSQPGNRLKAFVHPRQGELLVIKSVNSAFYGTPDLHAWLRNMDINDIVICGIQTNMCVETTARMAGNLGYNVSVALDATRTFDLTTAVPGTESPVTIRAAELMRVTAVNLQAGGFAKVVTAAELIATGTR